MTDLKKYFQVEKDFSVGKESFKKSDKLYQTDFIPRDFDVVSFEWYRDNKCINKIDFDFEHFGELIREKNVSLRNVSSIKLKTQFTIENTKGETELSFSPNTVFIIECFDGINFGCFVFNPDSEPSGSIFINKNIMKQITNNTKISSVSKVVI